MKPKDDINCYLKWYDRMVRFIADHYDCKITYPRNVVDINNMTDGLRLEFNRLDWKCYLTNFCVHQVFAENKQIRHTSDFKAIQSLLDNMLLAKIRK